MSEKNKKIPKNKNDKKKDGNLIFRIITLGDSGVGKTSIINRYVNNIFNENTSSTVGLNQAIKDVFFNKKEKVSLKLIDTCGQEKFKALTKSYLKNTDAVLFVFAFNDKDSFNNIKDWMNLFYENNKIKEKPQMLLGNKSDLKSEIDENLINDFVQSNKIRYIKTSAKDKININESIEEMGKILYQKYDPSKGQLNNIVISYKESKKKHNCSLCRP